MTDRNDATRADVIADHDEETLKFDMEPDVRATADGEPGGDGMKGRDAEHDRQTVGDTDPDADDAVEHTEDADGAEGGSEERVLLDDTEYGAVGDGIEIKAWQIDGLLRDNGNPYPPVHLRRNPPKLTFRRRVSDADYDDEYSVYLDRASARMLRDAMINVCNAYDFKPINKKRRKWTWRGFKNAVYDRFMDNPLKFIIKVVLGAFFFIILAFALFNIHW